MKRLISAFAALVLILPIRADEPITVAPTDWPWWRGPKRNGVADPNQKPPLKWSENENVLWKAKVPGRGHGSPIVVGDQVFLPTADHDTEVQSVLCYDRKGGKLLWQTEVHRGNFVKGGNAKSSLASGTMACDGHRVFVNFLNKNAIYTSALGRDGKLQWQTKVADYVLHQGFATSPAVYQSLVIVSADNKGGTGAVVALERATGKVVWKQERPKTPNYASPIILNVAGRDQLFMIGCELVTSLDPLTGRKHWEIPGSTTECVTSTVSDGQLMITSGGYPKKHVAAIHADGSGKIAWQINTQVYVPSLQLYKGHLYAVNDNGIVYCWQFDTGKEVWSDRVKGAFSASAVLVGDLLYAASESGATYVFRADPNTFEKLAENQLGNDVLATPTICGGRIFLRVGVRAQGNRQEWLYCVGQ